MIFIRTALFSFSPVDLVAPMTDHPLTVLFICDDWSSAKGGISVFNRRLAIEFAARGDIVLCLVKAASEAERSDASSRGVHLFTAEGTPSGPDLHIPVAAVLDRRPDVVVGHDRVSGHIAWLYARRYGSAVLVHVVHTAPAEIEPYKDRQGASSRIEQREAFTMSLGHAADVVAAVGPRLTQYTEHLLEDGYRGVSVARLDPGMDADPADLVRRVPIRPGVVIIGRTGDIELKGLDIAARAVAAQPVRPDLAPPVLFVRGAPPQGCDAVRASLVAMTDLARGRIDVRPFTEDAHAVRNDLRRAALCVMPSRAEGFGLVAWEALALGTPVLVSGQSGAADLLRRRVGPAADRIIVPVHDRLAVDVETWSAAIRRVFDDLPMAFAEVRRVRDRFLRKASWRSTVEALRSHVISPTARQRPTSRPGALAR